MSNLAVVKSNSSLPALSMTENELMSVLRSSLYVGAKDESIKLAVNYCKAAGLDIMQKPVHLVPMYDSKSKEMRDVVMPAIGLYRTQASRSGEMAGMDEPEFGEDVKHVFEAETSYDNYSKQNKTRESVTVTYPKWCKVTIRKLMANGMIAEYTAKELWLENYATASKDSEQPNAMWKKRPYAQLAKCAEAQALRKAFPELGSMPTADEMEGKEIDITATQSQQSASTKPEPTILDDATFKTISDKYRENVANGKKTVEGFIAWVENKGALMTDSQKAEVNSWTVKQPNVVEGTATEVIDDFTSAYNAEEAGK